QNTISKWTRNISYKLPLTAAGGFRLRGFGHAGLGMQVRVEGLPPRQLRGLGETISYPDANWNVRCSDREAQKPTKEESSSSRIRILCQGYYRSDSGGVKKIRQHSQKNQSRQNNSRHGLNASLWGWGALK